MSREHIYEIWAAPKKLYFVKGMSEHKEDSQKFIWSYFRYTRIHMIGCYLIKCFALWSPDMNYGYINNFNAFEW